MAEYLFFVLILSGFESIYCGYLKHNRLYKKIINEMISCITNEMIYHRKKKKDKKRHKEKERK